MKLNFPSEAWYKINCTVIILTMMTERGEKVPSKVMSSISPAEVECEIK
jgi:hypothetical protein